MFEATRPADLDAAGGPDRFGEFRVPHPQERLALLRQLRDGAVPVQLSSPDGTTLTSTVWSLDAAGGRIGFSADPHLPQLAALVQADEIVGVAYLESIKLQFDIDGLLLVHGAQGCVLQGRLPQTVYRFQRRSSYRVRPLERHAPTLHLRHPALPEMALALRVLDVSIGGCALWLPADVPALPPGVQVNDARIELDPETHFSAAFTLQHCTAMGGPTGTPAGMRLGCEWKNLGGAAERALQRWIDQAQKKRRLLTLD